MKLHSLKFSLVKALAVVIALQYVQTFTCTLLPQPILTSRSDIKGDLATMLAKWFANGGRETPQLASHTSTTRRRVTVGGLNHF